MGFNPVYMSPEEASALLDSTSVEIEELYNSLVG